MYLYLWKFLVNENPNEFNIFVLNRNHQYFMIPIQKQEKRFHPYNSTNNNNLAFGFDCGINSIDCWKKSNVIVIEPLVYYFLVFWSLHECKGHEKKRIVFLLFSWIFSMSSCHCLVVETFSRSMFHGDIAAVIIVYVFVDTLMPRHISEWNSMIFSGQWRHYIHNESIRMKFYDADDSKRNTFIFVAAFSSDENNYSQDSVYWNVKWSDWQLMIGFVRPKEKSWKWNMVDWFTNHIISCLSHFIIRFIVLLYVARRGLNDFRVSAIFIQNKIDSKNRKKL